jgi:hypothetical protein
VQYSKTLVLIHSFSANMKTVQRGAFALHGAQCQGDHHLGHTRTNWGLGVQSKRGWVGHGQPGGRSHPKRQPQQVMLCEHKQKRLSLMIVASKLHSIVSEGLILVCLYLYFILIYLYTCIHTDTRRHAQREREIDMACLACLACLAVTKEASVVASERL